MVHKQGFTLAEIFLALSLLVLLFTLAVVNFDRIRSVIGNVPPEEQIRQLISQGHLSARSDGMPVYLSFDQESNVLRLDDAHGKLLRSVQMGDPESSDLQIHFFRTLPEQRLEGESIYEIEEHPIDFILFHPTGATAPAEIHVTSVRHQLVITMDSFSSSARISARMD